MMMMMVMMMMMMMMMMSAFAAQVIIDVPASPGALNDAVDAIARAQRTAAAARGKPPTLRLAPGRHQLLKPLELTPAHSGLHFAGSKGGGASVVSGGFEIAPSAWAAFAPAACAGCGSIMRAPLPAGKKVSYSRQLYVGGVRANW